jgi:colanic acid/amylovoran biosynthesis glycosyltransferase
VDLALTVNALFAERLRRHGEFSNVEVLHLGVDLSACPRRAPHQDDAFALLFVGRLIEKKGAQVLLRAVSQLRDMPWRLHVIGEGPLRDALIAEARALGIASRVVFYGARDHEFALRMMASCDCFVLPSVTALDGDMEGIPVSLMEAMGIGIPVVSTFHSGIPELITDGVHGRLVPERNVDALAQAIREVRTDPARYVEAARARIVREFAMQTQYDRLFARLERLVFPPSRPVEQGGVSCLASQS